MSIVPEPTYREPGPRRFGGNAVLRDYFITPSRDFTQYTRDYEEQYWNRDDAFDWQQDVVQNLRAFVDDLAPDQFSRIATVTLPLLDRTLGYQIDFITRHGLPCDDDALKAISESLPCSSLSIDEALSALAPLTDLESETSRLEDQLAILEWQHEDAREFHRLGLQRSGAGLEPIRTDADRRRQATDLAALTQRVQDLRVALRHTRTDGGRERDALTKAVHDRLAATTPRVLAELNASRSVVQQARSGLPRDPRAAQQLRDLIWKRQLRGLKDIVNHALVVEQNAIAPLSVGIIHYRRHREIQEAMTTFLQDEAKHSAVFRRFLAEKLDARERIPKATIKAGRRYLWIARLMPSVGVFFAVVVESIGAAFLGFFGEEAHMPDPLFRTICKTIAERDEKRHQELCASTYNELYRTGSRWERMRNTMALDALLRTAYGDKTRDNPLVQACRAFGFESTILYRRVATQLSQQLAAIGLYLPPERFLAFATRESPEDARA